MVTLATNIAVSNKRDQECEVYPFELKNMMLSGSKHNNDSQG